MKSLRRLSQHLWMIAVPALLPGCVPVELLMFASSPMPCPALVASPRMIAGEPARAAADRRIVATSVTPVPPDKVRPVAPSLSAPDCWRRTGIDPKVFQQALQASLGIPELKPHSSARAPAGFTVAAQMLEQTEEDSFHMLGVMSRRARIRVKYLVAPASGAGPERSKDIATEHEVRYGTFVKGSPPVYEVSSVAFETAVKLNLEAFLRFLDEAPYP